MLSIQVLKASNYFRAPWQAEHQTMKEMWRMILVHVPMFCLQPNRKVVGQDQTHQHLNGLRDQRGSHARSQ